MTVERRYPVNIVQPEDTQYKWCTKYLRFDLQVLSALLCTNLYLYLLVFMYLSMHMHLYLCEYYLSIHMHLYPCICVCIDFIFHLNICICNYATYMYKPIQCVYEKIYLSILKLTNRYNILDIICNIYIHMYIYNRYNILYNVSGTVFIYCYMYLCIGIIYLHTYIQIYIMCASMYLYPYIFAYVSLAESTQL